MRKETLPREKKEERHEKRERLEKRHTGDPDDRKKHKKEEA